MNDVGYFNMPNKMYPGTWVLLGLVLLCALGGIAFILVRFFKAQVKWKKLPHLATQYFGKNHEPNTALLVECCKKVQELFQKHCSPLQPKWTSSSIEKALHDIRIYVMDEDSWVDEWGRKVAGIQAGRNLIVGRNLAAFLHEAAHRCEEVIDKERDMEHSTWVADGIRAADDEFATWLASQK